MSPRSLLSASLFLVLAASAANAGQISGQIRDDQGHPVPNALFEFKAMQGGGTPIVSGGFTDANGNFTTTVTPDDNYAMTVYPPAPPSSMLVTKRFDNVAVTSTPTNLGTLTLNTGVLLTGRVTNAIGTPLYQVNLDFLVAPDTQSINFTNNQTDFSGHFSVVVPYGECQVRFEGGPVPYYGGPGSAPTSVDLNSSGPEDLGDVVMPQGYTISGFVARASDNTAVKGADVEFTNNASGLVVYTPNNRTDNSGFYSVVVAAGDFTVHFIPNPNDDLAAGELQHLLTPPASFLPTMHLEDAFTLKGTVDGDVGGHLAGVQVTLASQATGQSVFIGDVVTKSNGSYTALVPSGTFQVHFSAPYTLPFGATTISNVSVNHNTTQDAALPSVPFFSTVGTGVAGLGGITPVIASSGGTPRLGNANYALAFSQARGGSHGVVIYSLGTPVNPLPNPMQVVPPMSRRYVTLGGAIGVAGAGTGSFAMPIDSNPAFAGQMLRAWLLVRDGASTSGLSSTNELRVTIAP